MINKIYFRYLLLLVALAVLLMVLFKGRSPFGKSNSSFASDIKQQITRIEFSVEGEKLTLQLEGDEWLINGKTETRKSSILFIQRVLIEMKIKSPVSEEIFNREIIKNNIAPVKVKVFEKRRLLKTFFVYKTRSNIYGNIMKIKERGKPFIVYVPGYEGDIGSGFTFNNLFWQPYTVFNLLPSEISSVNFENISDSASSFSIVNKDHYSSLAGTTGWDSTLVNRYLSYFTNIPFEEWAFDIDDDVKSSIITQQPLYRITVKTTEGITTVLTLWERMTEDNSTKDSDRLFGKTQMSDELFIMRYFDIDPLIKKRSYFFP